VKQKLFQAFCKLWRRQNSIKYSREDSRVNGNLHTAQ